jgi:hypothetical protein
VLVGFSVSVWASKFVASLLYGLEPRDPATMVGAAVMLAAVGALAGWWPAWRASRIELDSIFGVGVERWMSNRRLKDASSSMTVAESVLAGNLAGNRATTAGSCGYRLKR